MAAKRQTPGRPCSACGLLVCGCTVPTVLYGTFRYPLAAGGAATVSFTMNYMTVPSYFGGTPGWVAVCVPTPLAQFCLGGTSGNCYRAFLVRQATCTATALVGSPCGNYTGTHFANSPLLGSGCGPFARHVGTAGVNNYFTVTE